MRASVLLIALSCCISAAFAAVDFDTQQIQERIKPVGSVRTQANSQPAPAAEVKPAVAAAPQAPGQATYEQFCTTCHQNGLAGAPIFRDAASWKTRMAAKNIDALTASAIKGINAMPPKGTCSDCTDEQIKEAIQYMLPK